MPDRLLQRGSPSLPHFLPPLSPPELSIAGRSPAIDDAGLRRLRQPQATVPVEGIRSTVSSPPTCR